ncbi:MAG: hypothetical protein HYZ53_21160 [Planctomycetes bacterium]|nr:hypothetical protein [Planctomycetota bacterium]
MTAQLWTEEVGVELPRAETLAELLRAFNATTERLRSSHETLEDRVRALSIELEQKNRELERQNRLAVLGEMAACLAHEIRNPLGGITLYAGLLERAAVADEHQRDFAGKVLAGVKHLGRLVEDILSYTGNVVPELRPCEIHAVLEDALALWGERVEDRGLAIERRYQPGLVPLEADPDMLERVFLNVFLNAAHAMEGRGRLRLETRTDRRGNGSERVVVSISDTGPGLSAEALSRLFTPFYTSRSKGTGLGLAIAHRVVEGHRGEIRGENLPEGGARFVVALPIDPRPQREVPRCRSSS